MIYDAVSTILALLVAAILKIGPAAAQEPPLGTIWYSLYRDEPGAYGEVWPDVDCAGVIIPARHLQLALVSAVWSADLWHISGDDYWKAEVTGTRLGIPRLADDVVSIYFERNSIDKYKGEPLLFFHSVYMKHKREGGIGSSCHRLDLW